jgi:putative Holliday junction resolvase
MKRKPKGQRSALAFDFGVKSIGVASGNEITGKASPVTAVRARDGIPDSDSLDRVFREWQPDYVVVGLPLNMDGTYQDLTYRARKFGNRLADRYRLPVFFKDERLTTKEARAELFDAGGYRALGKGAVDALSAVYILEGYFQEELQEPEKQEQEQGKQAQQAEGEFGKPEPEEPVKDS